jgi:circadian clock protein KaiB
MTPSTATPNANTYQLRLIVAGSTIRSREAVRNLQRVCKDYLTEDSDVEVIDIYQQPALAAKYDVVAAPTLIRMLPLPVRRIIGDLSQTDRVLRALFDTGAFAQAAGP